MNRRSRQTSFGLATAFFMTSGSLYAQDFNSESGRSPLDNAQSSLSVLEATAKATEFKNAARILGPANKASLGGLLIDDIVELRIEDVGARLVGAAVGDRVMSEGAKATGIMAYGIAKNLSPGKRIAKGAKIVGAGVGAVGGAFLTNRVVEKPIAQAGRNFINKRLDAGIAEEPPAPERQIPNPKVTRDAIGPVNSFENADRFTNRAPAGLENPPNRSNIPYDPAVDDIAPFQNEAPSGFEDPAEHTNAHSNPPVGYVAPFHNHPPEGLADPEGQNDIYYFLCKKVFLRFHNEYFPIPVKTKERYLSDNENRKAKSPGHTWTPYEQYAKRRQAANTEELTKDYALIVPKSEQCAQFEKDGLEWRVGDDGKTLVPMEGGLSLNKISTLEN